MPERSYKADRGLIQREAASFIDAVEGAQREGRDGIVMTIDAFGNEPELLREVLVYAAEEGVAVTFAPDSKG